MGNSVAYAVIGGIIGFVLGIAIGNSGGTQTPLALLLAFAMGSLVTLVLSGWFRQNSAARAQTASQTDVRKDRPISGAQLVKMVSGQMASDVVETVVEVAYRIHPRITVQETCKVMSRALASDCLRILDALAPSIQGPLTPGDIDSLLSPLLASDRKAGSIAIANKVK